MKAKLEQGSDETDVLGWMHRCALELIGQGGLGYSLDNLVTPTRNEYGEALKKYLYVSALTLPSIDTKAQHCRHSHSAHS